MRSYDQIALVAGRAWAVRGNNTSMFLYPFDRSYCSTYTKAKKRVFSVLWCITSDYYFG